MITAQAAQAAQDQVAFLSLPDGSLTSAVIITEYAIKVLALGMVPENRQPGSSQAWLLAILFIPVVGVPLFLLFGNPYVTGRRHVIQARANQLYADALADRPNVPVGVRVAPGVQTILDMNRTLTAIPCMSGEFVALYSDYSESLAAMTAAVRSAVDHVHVEFYAQSWDDETDEFFTALVEAAERGVTVRVLADHLGSARYKGYKALRRRLRAPRCSSTSCFRSTRSSAVFVVPTCGITASCSSWTATTASSAPRTSSSGTTAAPATPGSGGNGWT